MRIDFKTTIKPEWYQFRWILSNFILLIAKLVYPENPDVFAFLCKEITDLMISGKAITRIDPGEMSASGNTVVDEVLKKLGIQNDKS